MSVHQLKTWPPYFNEVARGRKSFELRRDDRAYEVGDSLDLREWDPATNAYTGRTAWLRVTYVLRNAEQFGLKDGFVILGISP